MDTPLRLLAVFPHPDDESMGLGGTLAKYAAEGVDTHLVCATRGERGWGGAEDENPGLAALGQIREAELRCAAEQLGLQSVTFLDYIDGDVDQADPAEIIAKIVAQVRRIRPHVVVTFGPDGNYGHPDHIALAQFTAAALVCAAAGDFGNPDAGTTFRVSKFYYMVESKSTVQAIYAAASPFGMEIDGVQRAMVGWDEWAVTTRIDARAYFDTFWAAILCHKSQLAGFGPIATLPQADRLRIFGEGAFVRVFSLVNGGRGVETDLFEGLRA